MRALGLIALLSMAACSWDAETPDIFVQVDGIPAAADHLDVTVSSSDSSVQPKQYRPSFQPAALSSGSLQLAFTHPSTTGTFTVDIVAGDRTCPSPCPAPGLASGSIAAQPEPAAGSQANLQVTLK